jgi:HTH-like domain
MSCGARTRSSRPRRCFRDRARRRPTEVSRFIDEHRGRFGVEPICRVLGVSASAYYQRASGLRSARAVADERLLDRIRELHAANYHAYGYRRMWKALLRAGETVPRCRVQRLMRSHGIVGAKRRGRRWRTTRPDPDAHRRPRSRAGQVRRRGARSVVGRRPVLPQVLGGPGVRRLRHRRLQPPDRRLAVGVAHAHHAGARRAADGARPAPPGRRRRARASQRPRLAIHQLRLPRRSPTTASSQASGRSATPTTMRWPRASSTASRPSSSPTASGAPDPSSSSPSLSTSAGSTTTDSTRRSATFRRPNGRPT